MYAWNLHNWVGDNCLIISLNWLKYRQGAAWRHRPKSAKNFSSKQVVTQVILVVSRDFSFGLGNLFSHKSIGKLLNLWDDGKKNSLCKIAIIKIIIMSLQHHNHHGLHSLNLASLGVFLFRCLIALQTATAYDEKYVNQL